MEKNTKEKRSAKIVIWTTPKEKNTFKKQCEEANYTMSERLELLMKKDLENDNE